MLGGVLVSCWVASLYHAGCVPCIMLGGVLVSCWVASLYHAGCVPCIMLGALTLANVAVLLSFSFLLFVCDAQSLH